MDGHSKKRWWRELRASGALTGPRVLRQDRLREKVRLGCGYPVVSEGLAQVLGGVAEVRGGPPGKAASSASCEVVRPGAEDFVPDVPVLVVGLLNDVRGARSALRAGAAGFVHHAIEASQTYVPIADSSTTCTKDRTLVSRPVPQGAR
jgi:hypothetical protein